MPLRYIPIFVRRDIYCRAISRILFGGIYTVALYPRFCSEGYMLSYYIPFCGNRDIFSGMR